MTVYLTLCPSGLAGFFKGLFFSRVLQFFLGLYGNLALAPLSLGMSECLLVFSILTYPHNIPKEAGTCCYPTLQHRKTVEFGTDKEL